MAQADTKEVVATGWVVGPDGRLRRATKHHMGRRLPTWDYRRPAYYVVTIVLADRREPKLGGLVVRKASADADGAGRTDGDWVSIVEARALGLNPDEVEAKVVFTPLGKAIFDHFRRMGEFTPGLEPVYCAVMPDHLHLLVKVVRELKRPLGNAIGGFKTGCEKIYQRLGGEGRLFAEGFVDEIVLKAGQLSAEFDYLVDNPRRLAVKRLFPELFKVSREVAVRFRLATKGQGAGVSPALSEGGSPAMAAGVSPAPAAPAVGYFSAKNMGFSPLYKPGGKLFESCADGRLLMLAPAAWPYQVNEKPMTRFDATAMNRLCQWIAGDGAAEVNYRGLASANVDELACAAAKVKVLKGNERTR